MAVSLVALLLIAAILAYRVVDVGAALQQSGEEVERTRDAAGLLGDLVVRLPRELSQAQAFAFLSSQYPKRIVKQHDSTIEVDGILLEYGDGRLQRVRLM